MKQVFQVPATGELAVRDVPAPVVSERDVLVRTAVSAVSIGTERQMLDFGSRSLLRKALARPDLARRVWEVARLEGWREAYLQVRGRLDAPRALGYSSAGVVVEAGEAAGDLRPGDRVACSGSGSASHAEIVRIPAAQTVRLPDAVDFEAGAFATLGAIAVHAMTLAGARAGGDVAVIGLGLLGLLAVQVARAWECRVFATDPDPRRVELATRVGATLAIRLGPGVAESGRSALGGGADAVVIFAASASSEPLALAADLARFRARIIVPGVIGLEVPRRAFYEKELVLQISKDWGAGDESRGNLETFVELAARGCLDVHTLITHRVPIADARTAYALVDGRSAERPLGVVLTYPSATPEALGVVRVDPAPARRPGTVKLGVIGAGTFARATMLPIVTARRDIVLGGVATATGGSAEHVARRLGFAYATTDVDRLLGDATADAVLILTRHDVHASLVARGLDAGKAVFVEKPLALSLAELAQVVAAHRRRPGALMVGFNRRFSPFTTALRAWLDETGGPRVLTCRVNAGAVAPESWIHDPVQGGGRVLGEVCHFVDLMCCLAGDAPETVSAHAAGHAANAAQDLVTTLKFADGSLATIAYTALGDRRFSRERVEVFRGSSVGVIDNFRSMTMVRGGRVRRRRAWSVDRGHRAQLAEFVDAVRERRMPVVPFEAYLSSTLATLCVEESLRHGRTVDVRERRRALEALCAS